jgi:site-specific DNA-methyltransferase (adenine-specific)
MELINGNCLENLKDISNNSIDLVILDLPYGQTDCVWDIKINLDDLWIELKRIGKVNTAYIFFTTTKYGYELIKSNEKWFRYDLVWSKPSSNAGFLNCKRMPLRSHEMIYFFYNKLPLYNISEYHNKIKISSYTEKISNSDIYGKKKTNLKKSGPSWEPKLPKSILEFDIKNNIKSRLHRTQKPIELLKWLIKYYSKEGDVVLDPTMGSGSTGIACLETNRKFVGIELDNEIFELAKKRINEFVIIT